MSGFSIPPLDRAALLIDFDGTLVDIASSPDAVIVEPGMLASLARLRPRLGDALAVVSGRPIAQLDALLGDRPYAVAGEHGAALRRRPGAPIEQPELAEMPQAWLDEAGRIVARYPGAIVEPKGHGLVLHYRAAPESGVALHEAALALVAGEMARFTIIPAKMAWEIKPRGVDKGSAVRALMQQPPFEGRLPVFVGDDVTDEDGIAAASALGGVGLRVPEAFGDPGGVRMWLAGLAASA